LSSVILFVEEVIWYY